jgi:hypothetical protein
MEEETTFGLASIFAAVEDPRIERTKLHQLVDILMIAVCGVICGADGWVEIEEFGKAKAAWFQSWLALPNGIPSQELSDHTGNTEDGSEHTLVAPELTRRDNIGNDHLGEHNDSPTS